MENSWDNKWETVHKNQSWGRYPTEDLIRFIARNYYSAENRSLVSILDLGCGAGASTWYLAREGFDVTGIDGSKTAINKAEDYLISEGLEANLVVGDFINLPFEAESFDSVVDIASMQHNELDNIGLILAEVHRVLKKGGKFFSILVSDETVGADTEEIDQGPLAGKGIVSFFNYRSVKDLFTDFTDIEISSRQRDVDGGIYKEWLVSATKSQ